MITTEELASIRAAAIGDMLGDPGALDKMGPAATIFRLCRELERLDREADKLEKEADWLAERAGAKDCLMADTVENCTKKGFPCIACFRTAARKAVEEGEESCPKN